jgi:hypothetical protein
MNIFKVSLLTNRKPVPLWPIHFWLRLCRAMPFVVDFISWLRRDKSGGRQARFSATLQATFATELIVDKTCRKLDAACSPFLPGLGQAFKNLRPALGATILIAMRL